MVLYQFLASTKHRKIYKSHTKTIKEKYKPLVEKKI